MKISCQSCGAKYNIADEKVRGKIVKIACKKCGARIEIDGREPAEQAHDQDETRVFDQAALPPPAADTWTASIDDNDQREVTTAQLMDLMRQGVVTPDTFVWRDGMADWQAVRDIAELQSAVQASVPPPAAPAFPSEPPTAAYPSPSYDAPAGGNGGGAPLPAAGGGYGGPIIGEPSQPARLGGSRRGGAVDLFAAQAPGTEEEDVATSAPVGSALAMPPGLAMGGGKPIGARNENSVLFSLSALTASGPATAGAAVVPSDEEKSGLIDIQKLAAAAKPVNGARDDRAKLDDIMNLGGGGAFGTALGAPILAPPPAAALAESPAAEESKKSNKGLILAMGGIVALLLVVVIVLLGTRQGDEVAQKDGKPGLETPKADDKGDKKDTKKAAAEPTETAPAPGGEAPTEPGGPIGKPGTKPAAGGTAAAPGGTATAKPTTTTGDKPAPTTTSPGTKCTSLDCMMGGPKEPPKPAETAKPAPAAGAEFDKAAAKSALSSVPYKDCGSGGAGKVQVTFAPSGSVSSAVVTSGEYDPGTKSCIQNRFKGAKVPAFGGDPKSFGWSINL
ncbi:MAG: zinc-ribbon domain-containing protein [Deltaproteobacteria bacterium]|nr:zinc-ribbon domain-containing protein [Deltaproteobacteria bacterium]